jgi:hypothetical protein
MYAIPSALAISAVALVAAADMFGWLPTLAAIGAACLTGSTLLALLAWRLLAPAWRELDL